MAKIRYSIKGMTCAACVGHVERAAAGVLAKEKIDFTVSLLTNSLSVTYPEEYAAGETGFEQVDLFCDNRDREARQACLKREHRRQQAVLRIRQKYGKNAILKGMNLEEGATTVARNGQIGGHRA